MPVERLGIVGAGTMGGGIAEVAVLHGFPSLLYDIDEWTVAAARERVRASLDRHVQRQRLSPEEAETVLARLMPTTRLDDVAGPLALADQIGLEVLLAVIEGVHDETKDDAHRPAPLLKRMVQAGWTGRTAGRGFFTYESGQNG